MERGGAKKGVKYALKTVGFVHVLLSVFVYHKAQHVCDGGPQVLVVFIRIRWEYGF